MADRIYDAAIAGGGLVGAAAALALARAGRHVALVDAQRPQAIAGALGFDLRCVAVAPASYALLNAPAKAAAIARMRVWEEAGTAEVQFEAASAGAETLAWVVENSATAAALWDACAAHPNVDLVFGAVTALARRPAALVLSIDAADAPNGQAPAASGRSGNVAAQLVIAADGAESRVSALAGVKTLPRGSGDSAIATVAETERPHGDAAWQRFTAAGPLALLPLSRPNSVAIVWSMATAQAKRLQALPDQAFSAALQAASQEALGCIKAVDRRVLAPLAQRLAEHCNPLPRLLIIGDAARTAHPLAGQGVNLGLEDVARIAQTAQSAERDLGRPNLWRAFAWRRRLRGEATLAAMTALRASYGYSGPVGRWLRNAGVRQIDGARALKRRLILEAMGVGPVASRL